MADILTNVEASVLRYLYENLEVAEGIKVFEDIYTVDFNSFSEWVVIDSLGGSLGATPRANYFFHCAQQKGMPVAKENLAVLCDKVLALFDQGTGIPLYDYTTGIETGTIWVVSVASFSPVIQHKGGGSVRALPVTITFAGS